MPAIVAFSRLEQSCASNPRTITPGSSTRPKAPPFTIERPGNLYAYQPEKKDCVNKLHRHLSNAWRFVQVGRE
jgi:hypothetical protein